MKRWLVMCIAVLSLLSAAGLYSATPGNQSGKRVFREWQPPVSDPSKRQFGDPSWARRMRERRLLREKIASGRTELAATLRSDNFSLPVLLGNFSDETNIKSRDEFQTVLFGQNPSGSMIDFYREISYGQFELSGMVYGWFGSDQNKAYYVDKNAPYEFVRDIAAKADPTVNYANYDNDGPDGVPNSGDDDGYVDAVYVICPGYEDNEAFHAHMWTLESSGLGEYETDDPAIGGGNIKINTYAITEELFSGDSENYVIQPIGTLCHEFGHILGLPDLYDRTGDDQEPDFRNSEGLGQWCLMGSGNYGADGGTPSRPVQMSAWCKIQMGWISPTVVSSNGQVSLAQVETNPTALKIWEDSYHSFRYFLIENRQAAGFDRDVPNPGMLIYHVDESRTWDMDAYAGPGNDDYRMKLVDLEEADGVDDLDNGVNRSDGGDPFPGSSGARTFDDSSTPNSKDGQGNSTGIAIREISDPGETMTAMVTVRSDNGYTLAYDEKGMNEFFTYSGSNNWVGVQFTAAQSGKLEALILGIYDEDVLNYQIRIYDGLSGGVPGNLLATQSFTAQGQAWQTVTLDNPIELTENAEFFVAVNGIATYAADGKGAVSGKSFFSNNGTSFSPLIGLSGNVDYTLRALIRTAGGTTEPTQELFTGAIGDCTVTATTGYYDLWVEIESAQAGAAIYLIAGTDEGASFPDTVVCTASGNRYTGKLAALPGGSHYYFYFEGRSKDGFLHTMPLFVPANYYTLTVDAPKPFFTRSTGNPSFSTTSGYYQLWADVDPSYSVTSVKLIARKSGSASFSDTVACTRSGNRFTGQLAALPIGSSYSFFFLGTETGGAQHRLPENAPAGLYTATVSGSGDLDGNGKTDVFDLLAILKVLGGSSSPSQGSDLNNDGKTDVFDLLALLKKLAQ